MFKPCLLSIHNNTVLRWPNFDSCFFKYGDQFSDQVHCKVYHTTVIITGATTFQEDKMLSWWKADFEVLL
ncbi:hypothetical protein AB6A40_005377 [Gnathostoma spinigerum]|uniref:Uncharacterized protein n=1 Tax=Gnathostoma spinigerum TaxID=75299 RepID=A0ABD6EFA3_9BILA